MYIHIYIHTRTQRIFESIILKRKDLTRTEGTGDGESDEDTAAGGCHTEIFGKDGRPARNRRRKSSTALKCHGRAPAFLTAAARRAPIKRLWLRSALKFSSRVPEIIFNRRARRWVRGRGASDLRGKSVPRGKRAAVGARCGGRLNEMKNQRFAYPVLYLYTYTYIQNLYIYIYLCINRQRNK